MTTGPASPSIPVRAIRIILAAVGATFLIWVAFFTWIWLAVFVPRWLSRGLAWLLWPVLVAFLASLTVAPVGALSAVAQIRRARRLGRSWVGAARVLMLCVSCLLGAAFLETGAAAYRAWTFRPPSLPTRFVEPKPKTIHGKTRDVLTIVVIGESSARGEPYNPFLSVGQIVGWKLEKVLGRPVRVDIRAYGGTNLRQAVDVLKGLDTRPDAIMLYSGHNEFQTRFGWSRGVAYYPEQRANRSTSEVVLETLARRSSLCGWVGQMMEKQQVDLPPMSRITRALVDVPVTTTDEYESLRADFHRRLEHVVRYCERIGALPLLVIPAGNDSDFEPNRSVMSPDSSGADRRAFARDFLAARALEMTDPARALVAFRRLIERQPGFAESHFRLARLLEREGCWGEARIHDTKARDLDGYPQRCPSDLQQAYRDVAARHDVVLVDGPAVLEAVGPRHGLVGDELFHDAHHPNIRGYVALAQEMLARLRARRAFGWPEGRETPVLRVADVARHVGMDAMKWSLVFNWSLSFYSGTAYIRYDPTARLEHARLYREACERLASGGRIEETGVPGLEYLVTPGSARRGRSSPH